MNLQKATLGGGCFWCLGALFSRVRGVESVVSGYAGGKKENPTYGEISGGGTGYIEVVQLSFDPQVISFDKILEMYFFMHDPTSHDKQGNDTGSQYRSVIFYHKEKQKEISEKVIKEIAGNYSKLIVTEVRPLEKFYTAEEYHQKFYERNKDHPYCNVVIAPKVKKFDSKFKAYLKSSTLQ
jgi:peptide-methionine (S)-S-oxide reductase